MLLHTDLGLEEGVELGARGPDGPPFLHEGPFVVEAHAVSTPINSTLEPITISQPNRFLQMLHDRLFPSKALCRPFPEDLKQRVAVEGPRQEVDHALQHGPLMSLPTLQSLPVLPSQMVEVTPWLPAVTSRSDPDATWFMMIKQLAYSISMATRTISASGLTSPMSSYSLDRARLTVGKFSVLESDPGAPSLGV